MIKFYDANGEAHPLTDYEDYSILHKLDGCDILSFRLDMHHELYPLLCEEERVVAGNNEWLIKKIDDDRIACRLNFDFLKRTVYQNYESLERPLQTVLESHLPAGWTIEGGNVSSVSRTIRLDYCTDFDVIYQCMKTYKVFFVWNIVAQRLTVYSQTAMGSTGEYLTKELNLKSLTYRGNTVDFATRLYAYGKGGLTMEDAEVDGAAYGLTYVENKAYADKTVCAYWSDERYTTPDGLYEAATKMLSTLAFPVRSYECRIVDLAKLNPEYSFLDFRMHKKITLVDADRGVRVEHQIVEYEEYPDEPERNTVVLSCVPETITTSIHNIAETIEETEEHISTDFSDRIAAVTAMLLGAFGGYVYSDGTSIYLMDNPDPALAQVVWCWNINGFGKSSTGIEGPYTTAITFDDHFITSVIDAIVIRGELIEAGSIQAGSISQSYTDGVLEQSFTAAQGLVEMMAQQINTYLTNPDGDGALDVINTTISDIQATIEGLTVSIANAYSGGINYIKNSSGLNGVSDDWEATGDVDTVQNADTKANTVANSCFKLSANATLKQTVDNIIVGANYSISVKVKKEGSLLGQIKIVYNGNAEKYLYNAQTASGWQEYTADLPNMTSAVVEIVAASSGNYLYFADLMLCEGTAKAWTPAPYEIYTTYTKIDENGVQVWRSDSPERTAMTNTEFAGYYNDEETFSLNKYETRMSKAIARDELTVGKAKFIKYSGTTGAGLNIVLLD